MVTSGSLKLLPLLELMLPTAKIDYNNNFKEYPVLEHPTQKDLKKQTSSKSFYFGRMGWIFLISPSFHICT